MSGTWWMALRQTALAKTLEVARNRPQVGAVGPSPAGPEHVERDIQRHRAAVQAHQQVGAPAPAGAEIENKVVLRRIERQHRHGEIVQQRGALDERVRARV